MSNRKNILFLTLLVLTSLISGLKTNTDLKVKNKLRTQLFLQEITTQTASQAFCFLNNNGTVFDINPLHNKTKDYNISGADYTLNFNVCKNANSKCGNRTSLVSWRSNSTGTEECVLLAGAESVVSKWAIISK